MALRTDRGTGKTTRLMEQAVALLATLPEDERVYITGAHTTWLKQLEGDFRSSGLVDVVFITTAQICNGALRGRAGVLLIDDLIDMPSDTAAAVLEERNRLRSRA